MLTLYRRHLKTCPNAGDRFLKKGDKCPVWLEGVDPHGVYHRKTLRTSSWDIGEKLMRDMMLPPVASTPTEPKKPESATLQSAIQTFMANMEGESRAEDTVRKYRLLFKMLREFADARNLSALSDLTFERLVAFRKAWPQKGAATRNKMLDRLKAFFSLCHSEGLISQNPTRSIKAASSSSAMPDPFTPAEQKKILAKPQVARIRCFVHVLFYSALRISDVCMLRPEDFDESKIRRVNRKNSRTVLIPIPPYLKAELDRIPLNGGHYFLIGESARVATQTDAWRDRLNDMFKADMPGFHAHRFRHTAAVNWLTSDPPLTIEEVAGLLGNSVKVVERHYATWSGARQQTVEDKLAKMWETKPKLLRVK